VTKAVALAVHGRGGERPGEEWASTRFNLLRIKVPDARAGEMAVRWATRGST
jgi:hypothetical protein